MQTNDNSHENKKSRRNFTFITLAAVAVAGALGAAFVLGGRRGDSAESSVDAQAQVSPTASQAPQQGDEFANPVGQSGAAPDAGSAPQDEHADSEDDLPDPTATPVPADEGEDEGEEETPTDTPTATSTPTGECAFCPEGLDLVAETPTDPEPCPECVLDLDIAFPVDVTAPVFEDISTTFCFPVFQVEVEVDAPAEVWFEYEYLGADYESAHMDAANTVNIGEDMSSFDWGVFLINVYYVHAIDLSGNHAVSAAQAMPDPELC